MKKFFITPNGSSQRPKGIVAMLVVDQEVTFLEDRVYTSPEAIAWYKKKVASEKNVAFEVNELELAHLKQAD